MKYSKINAGERLKALIAEKNLSQAEVARRMGKTPQYLNRVLSEPSLKWEAIAKIWDASGITASDFFKDEFAKELEEKAEVKYLKKINELQDQIIALHRQIAEKEKKEKS